MGIGIKVKTLVFDREQGEFVPARKRRQSELFVKGPIPLAWLERAAQLPGKSLHVGLSLWFLAGRQISRQVALGNHTAGLFAADQDAKRRALAWLESAGLISVQRKGHASPVVTIKSVRSSSKTVTPPDSSVHDVG
jgi:hypothetical protein